MIRECEQKWRKVRNGIGVAEEGRRKNPKPQIVFDFSVEVVGRRRGGEELETETTAFRSLFTVTRIR